MEPPIAPSSRSNSTAPEAGAPLAPEAPRKRRPWTILGRLTQAVREQNWFAVVLEVLIVIVGVVIGFQVTGWGQARADRASEQAYLHQLANDLRETERRVAKADSAILPSENATGALMRSFYAQTRPSRDSLQAWIFGSGRYELVNAVTGTAEALVATGDLALIRSDSLRSAITAYLSFVDLANENLDSSEQMHGEATEAVRSVWDGAEEWRMVVDLFEISEYDPLFPLPEGPHRRLGPFNAEAFLSDLAMERTVNKLLVARLNMRGMRAHFRDETVALREQVEAEIER